MIGPAPSYPISLPSLSCCATSALVPRRWRADGHRAIPLLAANPASVPAPRRRGGSRIALPWVHDVPAAILPCLCLACRPLRGRSWAALGTMVLQCSPEEARRGNRFGRCKGLERCLTGLTRISATLARLWRGVCAGRCRACFSCIVFVLCFIVLPLLHCAPRARVGLVGRAATRRKTSKDDLSDARIFQSAPIWRLPLTVLGSPSLRLPRASR